MEYPEIRNLDGVYFRIQRGNNYENICFSDLTEEEQDKVMENRSEQWLKSLCKILGKNLHSLGDYVDVCGG